jgi:hypothetical protein
MHFVHKNETWNFKPVEIIIRRGRKEKVEGEIQRA